MSTKHTSETPLKANYMTQQEANEVMELWAERQRDEAARNSMITVHDVAEATQLTSDDVMRLLNEIRTSKPHETVGSVPRLVAVRPQNEISLGQAYVRLAPMTGVIAFFLACFLADFEQAVHLYFGRATSYRVLVGFLFAYSFGVAILCVAHWIQRKMDQAAVNRANNVSHRDYGR